MNEQRIEQIRAKLSSALAPQTLEIEDQSYRHVGHQGARDGRGHFAVVVVAARFRELSQMQRHRMIYAALGDMMTSDIHALTITAFADNEIAS